MDSFTREFAFNASEQLFLDETLTSIADFFAGANESEGALGACNFGKFLCINVRKCYRGKDCFDTQAPSSSELFYLEPGSHHFFTDIVEATNELTQERFNQTNFFLAFKMCLKSKSAKS